VQVLIKWLFDIARYVSSHEVGDSSDNGKKACSALIILDIFFKLKFSHQPSDVPPNYIKTIFSMLQMRPELPPMQRPKFSDLNFLMMYIPDCYYTKIAEVLVHFTNQVLPTDSGKPEWVYVLPLIHIFDRRVTAFDFPELKSASIRWTDEKVNLDTVSKNRTTPAKIARYQTYSEIYAAKKDLLPQMHVIRFTVEITTL
jgi:hypothetical protein